MSNDLEIAICRSTHNTSPIPLCLPPVPFVSLTDINELRDRVVRLSKLNSFIVLLLDLNNENSNPVLEDLKKQDHVFAIFVCVKPKCYLPINGGNVFPVAKQFITRKLTLSVIQFFERASKQSLRLNQISMGYLFKQKANALKQQLFTNGKIKGCHVLIVPLNTTDENLFDFQERVINLCNGLCGDYEPTVYTLYDYISQEEGLHFDTNEYADIILNFVRKISGIVIYLVGNEMYIPNASSKYFYQNEFHNVDVDEYDEKTILAENEPVSPHIRSNLAAMLDCTRQSGDITLTRLDQIQDDINFPAALERVNAKLQGREMVADVEMYQRAMQPSEKSLEYSDAFHNINQTQNSSSVQNDGDSEEMDNLIQYNLMQSSPN